MLRKFLSGKLRAAFIINGEKTFDLLTAVFCLQAVAAHAGINATHKVSLPALHF
jgi:hypothetical protein